jgi:hypothetical protein
MLTLEPCVEVWGSVAAPFAATRALHAWEAAAVVLNGAGETAPRRVKSAMIRTPPGAIKIAGVDGLPAARRSSIELGSSKQAYRGF